uniref:C-type lectin domain-containing protein n=1 Tax=Knipowitschia caucasica TaxID=637954 RepID=A0AAV2IYX3_KNICA
MDQTLLLSVLLSQLCLSVSLDLQYHFIDKNMSWSEAQSHCREFYTDLASVNNMKDLKNLKAAANGRTDAWIGLHQTSDKLTDRKWHWSQPTVRYKEGHDTWQSGQPNDAGGPQNCVGIFSNESSNTTVMINDANNKRTWTEAQQFCRTHHTDLMSGLDQLKLLQEQNFTYSSFWCWFGLFRDTWSWSDRSDSSFRNWNSDTSINPQTKKCAALGAEGRCESDECGLKKSFICEGAPKNTSVGAALPGRRTCASSGVEDEERGRQETESGLQKTCCGSVRFMESFTVDKFCRFCLASSRDAQQQEMAMQEKFIMRVIVSEGDIRKSTMTTRPDTLEELIGWLKGTLQANYNFVLQYQDPDFNNELCNLEDVSDLPDKPTIKIIPMVELYPEGLDDHNLEAARQVLVNEMMKAKPNGSLIKKEMDRTFALRRKEVVTDKPAITQIVQRWPALFSESQVCCEFTRVVGKNLKENFFEALDRFSPNLMDLFRKKKGLSGQILTDLLRQTKTTEPTDIRCLCLRGLPVVLGDDPSAFFKTCSDATDKDLYSETSVGILCIDEHPQLNPSRVSIVLEGSQLCWSVSLDLQYHFIDKNMLWSEAQSHCREFYTDLASVNDMKDRKNLKAAANGRLDRTSSNQ